MLRSLSFRFIVSCGANIVLLGWHANPIDFLIECFIGFLIIHGRQNHHLFTWLKIYGVQIKFDFQQNMQSKEGETNEKHSTPTVQLAGVATIGKRSTNCNESMTRKISLQFKHNANNVSSLSGGLLIKTKTRYVNINYTYSTLRPVDVG